MPDVMTIARAEDTRAAVLATRGLLDQLRRNADRVIGALDLCVTQRAEGLAGVDARLQPFWDAQITERARLRAELLRISPVRRLIVPALGIDTSIEPVGLLLDGQQVGAALDDTAAWFAYGPAPGDSGQAFIGAHSSGDRVGDGAGIFGRLLELPLGAEVVVEDSAAFWRLFEAVERHIVAAGVSTAAISASRTSLPKGAELILGTCHGVPDALGASPERVVVFCDLAATHAKPHHNSAEPLAGAKEEPSV